MSYSAGIYDIYDDNGALLKEYIPSADGIPEVVKTAASVDQGTPANCFALIMIEDGKAMKKFATVDAGNTWLSSLYFVNTKDNLPEEAQKVAAANLLQACEAYGIEAPTELYDLLPDEEPNTNVVDVTNMKLASVKAARDEEDVHFAIERADGSKHYPLDSAASVKAASAYFEQYERNFSPRERREFSVKTAAQANKHGLNVSKAIEKYAGAEYNPALGGFLTMRYQYLLDTDAEPEMKSELMKLAKSVEKITPEEFAEQLERFDISAGIDSWWDRWVPDPWYSTFGLNKVAKGDSPMPVTFQVGTETVTQEELETLAAEGREKVSHQFGEQFFGAFCKDPVNIFESMPLPQKKILARLASEVFHG